MGRRATLIAVLAVALAGGCADDPAAALDGERAHLEQREGQFLAALADRDADAIGELFAEDAVVHVADMPPIEGRDAIRRFYGNVFGFLSASSATPGTTHMSRSADVAYGTGTTTNEFRGPEGTVEYEGKYLLVWQRGEEGWVVAVYGISSNAPESGG